MEHIKNSGNKNYKSAIKFVKQFITSNIYFIFVAVLLLIIFFRWFLPGDFLNGDTWLVMGENINYTNNIYLWKQYHNLGVYYAESALLLISYIASFPARLSGLSYNSFTIKALFLYPYLLLAPLGMFLLTKKVTKSNIASAVSALLFTINTPNISSLAMGHLHTVTASIFFPFILLNTMNLMEKKNTVRNLIFLNTLFVLCGIYELRIAYISFLWLSLFLVVILLKNGLNALRKVCLVFISVILCLFIANLYWLIPSITSYGAGGLVSNPILNRPVFGGDYLNILNPLTLFHPYWTSGEIAVFTKQTVPYIFFYIPLFSILGWLFNRKNKYVMYFALLLIVGIVLTKQFNPPYGVVYRILFDHVPGFKLFREPMKFFNAVGLAHSVLLGLFIAYLEKSQHKKCLITTLFVFFVIILTIAVPIISGKAKTIYVPINTKDESYDKLNKYLSTSNNENGFFRVLWIPTASSLGLIRDTMPHMHLDALESNWLKKNENTKGLNIRKPTDILLIQEMNNIFDIYSIKFLVIPKGKTSMEGDFYHWYGDREEYVKTVEKIPFLKKVDIGDNKISIYENTGYYPHIFASTEPLSLISADFSRVDYENVSPVEYKIKINSLKERTYLNIGEAYHQEWKAYFGKIFWSDVFWKNESVFDDKYHIHNDADLNSYLLDPAYIKKNFNPQFYKVNSDGSLNFELTVYFRTQAYMYLGLVISGVVFSTLLLGATLYHFYIQRKSHIEPQS